MYYKFFVHDFYVLVIQYDLLNFIEKYISLQDTVHN